MHMNWPAVIESYLVDLGLNFSKFKNKPAYTLSFDGKNTALNLIVIAIDRPSTEDSILIISGKLPHSINKDCYAELLSYLNNKNHELFLGNFGIHEDSNKIIFKLGREIWPDFNPKKLESLIFIAATELDDLNEDLINNKKHLIGI